MAFERVLAVGAHPDDCEFFAGGALAALAREGARVTLCICTDGARGSLEDDAGLAARRRAEAERAASALGATEVVMLGHPDGALRDDDVLIGDLVCEIRRVRPLLVLAHDPDTRWTRIGERYHLGHTDHHAAGRAALAAVYPRAPLPTYFPEQIADGLAPWWVPELWLFDTATPDWLRPLGESFDAKRAALACHESQDGAGVLVSAAEALADQARTTCGVPAEAFRRVPLRP
jgi:LmbE family N-acetylglucosaminyl deacetylase